MMCVTYSFTILSLIIFNFPLVFKISLLFVEIYVYMFKIWNLFINSNKTNDILKTKKIKIMRANIEEYNMMNNMTSRIINSVQCFFKEHHFLLFFTLFHNLSYFSYIIFPLFI